MRVSRESWPTTGSTRGHVLAEHRVLRWLGEHLPPGWTLWYQPEILGRRPDIVAVHPRRGVVIVEVKNWDLRRVRVEPGRVVRRAEDGSARAWPHPGDQLRAYGELVRRVVAPGAVIREWWEEGLVRLVLVVPHPAAMDRAARLFGQAEKGWKPGGAPPVVLDVRDLAWGRVDWLPRRDRWPDTWVRPLELALADPIPWGEGPLPGLSGEQRRVLGRATRRLYVQGPAGTGKTRLVAELAAREADAGREVLVLCYNIALREKLRRLITRIAGCYPPGVRVTWFHEWMRVPYEARCWHGWHRWHRARWPEEVAPGELAGLFDAVPPTDEEMVDTVIVDEAQDFRPAWFELLGRVLRAGGRMWAFGDPTQARIAGGLEPDSAADIGFSKAELRAVHRLHRQLQAPLAMLADAFPPGAVVDLPRQLPLPFGELRLFWVRAPRDARGWAATFEVLDEVIAHLGRFTVGRAVRLEGELAVLFEELDMGRAWLEGRSPDAPGGEVQHVFAPGVPREGARADQVRRAVQVRNRALFGAVDDRLCVSTIESAKGHEWRAVILVLGKADPKAVYRGLTRVRQDPSASVVVVLSPEPASRFPWARAFEEREPRGYPPRPPEDS